ncbi:MAG: CPBP family intramembrane metalloprotease [Robiginitomaculum sp.]|nr:CPBP family intramembrane metalloprotease [Robiginitomaculum sp.]
MVDAQNTSYKSEVFAKIGAQSRLHPIYTAFVPIIAVILMMVVMGVAMVPLALLSARESPSGDLRLIYVLIAGFGAVSLAVFAWVKWVENRSLASIGWTFDRALLRYGRGFAVGLLMNVAAIAIIALLGGYEAGNWLPAFSSISAIAIIVLFLVGFIVQGATEEILVRGWILSSLAARWGLPLAVGVTSLLFALLHLSNEWPHVNYIAMFNIVLISIFFAIYVLRERSLLGVCAIHSAWNWIMSIGFGLNVSGLKIDVEPLVVGLSQKPEIHDWITGGSFGPEGSLVVTAVIGLSCYMVWRWGGDSLDKSS